MGMPRVYKGTPVVKNFNVKDFFERVEVVKDEMGIVANGDSNDTKRRRVTLSCVEAFLLAGGSATQAYFFEAELYARSKDASLSCKGRLPDEDIFADKGRFGRDNPDARRLVSETYAWQGAPSCLITKLLEVLSAERTNPKDNKSDTGKGIARHPRNLPVDSREKEGRGPTLHRTRKGQTGLSRRKPA